MTSLVLISDTHLAHERGDFDVPEGDILIHAGDATNRGTIEEVLRFRAWFEALPHRHKVFVAGNHDWFFQSRPEEARQALGRSIHYLCDSEITLEGVRIYGSPWQPEFCDWAFNLPRGEALQAKWRQIPAGVDLLVTHGPPRGIGDVIRGGESEGCDDLLEEVLGRVRPRVHLFGHIHEGYGVVEREGIQFVNAALVDERYRIANPGIVVEI